MYSFAKSYFFNWKARMICMSLARAENKLLWKMIKCDSSLMWMTCFCIFLQFLIFCSTPTVQRPVRLTLWNSSKAMKGGFHNQPRQLTSRWRWERKPKKFKGQQRKKSNSRCGRFFNLHKRKRSNKRKNARQVFCSKKLERGFLLKVKEKKKLKITEYCRKQVRKKRQNCKIKGKSVEQNKRQSKKNRLVRKSKREKKEQQTRKDAKRRKRNTRATIKTCLKREQKKIRNRTGKWSVREKIKNSCCKKKKKCCQKVKDRRHKTPFIRIQMQIGQGGDLVGLDELHHLERSSVYRMKVAQE